MDLMKFDTSAPAIRLDRSRIENYDFDMVILVSLAERGFQAFEHPVIQRVSRFGS